MILGRAWWNLGLRLGMLLTQNPRPGSALESSSPGQPGLKACLAGAGLIRLTRLWGQMWRGPKLSRSCTETGEAAASRGQGR